MKLTGSIIIYLICFQSLGKAHSQQYVSLSGTYVNGGDGDYVSDISEHGDLKASDIIAQFFIDKQNHFNVKFELNKPTYCRLGRNILYLTPGDSLIVHIDRNEPNAARFKGIGEEANMYLRNTPFPNSGSYLSSGANIKGTFLDTWNYILSETKKREQQLLKLTTVTTNFKLTESGRIVADKINSLKLFKIYLGHLDSATASNIKHSLSNVEDSIINTLTEGFWNDDLLCLEVYRGLLLQLQKKQDTSNLTEMAHDWVRANQITRRLGLEKNRDNYDLLKLEIKMVKDQSYRQILEDNYKANSHRFDKFEAPIFSALDNAGKKVSIQDYIGKVIYIDVWATWCGPCIKEIPYFEKLKSDFKHDTTIVFISLSADVDKAAWLSFLKKHHLQGIQWNTMMQNLSRYFVSSLPRYILIDREFLISDLNAPPPSGSETKSILLKLLEGSSI